MHRIVVCCKARGDESTGEPMLKTDTPPSPFGNLRRNFHGRKETTQASFVRCSQFVDFADMLAAFKLEDLERAIAYTAQLAALSPCDAPPRSRAHATRIPCATGAKPRLAHPNRPLRALRPVCTWPVRALHRRAKLPLAPMTRKECTSPRHLTASPHRVSTLRSCLSLRLAFRNLAHAPGRGRR